MQDEREHQKAMQAKDKNFHTAVDEVEFYKKDIESVETAVKNYEKDLPQFSKEPSEGEFYKKAISQTKMEAAGSKDPDDKPPEVNSLVGEENENLAGNGKHPEVNDLVDKENKNLVGDGKPSEVIKKKLIRGSEAEEVPEVLEAAPDEAPNTEHDSKSHSGDDADEEEKAP